MPLQTTVDERIRGLLAKMRANGTLGRDEPEPHEGLQATDVIDSDHPAVRAVAERVAGDAEGAEAAQRLFTFVRDEIKYEMCPNAERRDDWRASAVLEQGYGFCQQKAVVLASLLRARGIPSAIVLQDLLDHKIPPHYVALMETQRLEVHGLSAAHIDGRWVRLDATLPRKLVEKKGYRLVEFDGTNDAVLHETDLAGEPHFTLVQEFGTWTDMPDEIVEHTTTLEFLHLPEFKQVAQKHGPGM
jgi:transglutaminase-like putative cysteine protease